MTGDISVRLRTEELERQVLSRYAACSADSRGRERPEDQCAVRTVFQRDRDRIIHSKAFRRLKHKTQVFVSPEGDHYRTRLTHTLEVAQIARTVARALRLNEDLTEAIALGHDLGHTPFGHTGEEVLDGLLPGGFRHNEQSLRVVDVLEGDGGLNLTWEVRNGILHHTGPEPPATLEGQVVKIADRVAYINHDIDDALRAGVLKETDLPGELMNVLGTTHAARINLMVRDLIESSYDRPVIRMSRLVREATDLLRAFLFERVYIGSAAKREETKAKHLLQALYRHYVEHPGEMPEWPGLYQGDRQRAAADYVAGMTDRYAIHQYQRLFLPVPWRFEATEY